MTCIVTLETVTWKKLWIIRKKRPAVTMTCIVRRRIPWLVHKSSKDGFFNMMVRIQHIRGNLEGGTLEQKDNRRLKDTILYKDVKVYIFIKRVVPWSKKYVQLYKKSRSLHPLMGFYYFPSLDVLSRLGASFENIWSKKLSRET